MINLIIGKKGSGKTSRMVDDLNEHAVDHAQNVVCIERGRRLDRYVKYQIRLIDISEYPVEGFDNLLSFIAGISSKDYDITHVYIDSIFKVAQDDSYSNLEDFCENLNKFLEQHKFIVNILLSTEEDYLSDRIKELVNVVEY
ncbi:MAG TPA: hypothetical protein GX717_07310 [Clostridiaceae bacterium]|nr:hypothetical protein [Clostridiaceae bacterium]